MQTERQGAREQLVTALLEGQSWPQVSAGVCVPLKRAMAYRLLRAVRTKGKVALQDGRHGHPSKLRGEIRAFLETFCREAVHTPSSVIQKLLQERFAVSVSISQLNRVRAQLGGSLHPRNQDQEKKGRKGWLFTSTGVAARCWEPAVACCRPSNETPDLAGDGPLAESADR